MEPPAPPPPIIDVGPLEGTTENERKRIISMNLNFANILFSYNAAEWDDLSVKPFLNHHLPFDPYDPRKVENDRRIAGGRIESSHQKNLSLPA